MVYAIELVIKCFNGTLLRYIQIAYCSSFFYFCVAPFGRSLLLCVRSLYLHIKQEIIQIYDRQSFEILLHL